MKSRGLGDTIEKITKATGVKSVVDKVAKATGKDCGCNKRRDTLNRIFPYQKSMQSPNVPPPQKPTRVVSSPIIGNVIRKIK
tara:strand:- start:529 stop:774 length:246 start_codon:yes stop_codon:yes gene_type:complete